MSHALLVSNSVDAHQMLFTNASAPPALNAATVVCAGSVVVYAIPGGSDDGFTPDFCVVLGKVPVRGARPLAIDNLVEMVGRARVRRFQSGSRDVP